MLLVFFFFSSRRRHTRWPRDWSSDVCSSDLLEGLLVLAPVDVEGDLQGFIAGAQLEGLHDPGSGSGDPVGRRTCLEGGGVGEGHPQDRKSTRLNSSHVATTYAVSCLT